MGEFRTIFNQQAEIERLKKLLWDTQKQDVSDIQFWRDAYHKMYDKWLLEWTAHTGLKMKFGVYPYNPPVTVSNYRTRRKLKKK